MSSRITTHPDRYRPSRRRWGLFALGLMVLVAAGCSSSGSHVGSGGGSNIRWPWKKDVVVPPAPSGATIPPGSAGRDPFLPAPAGADSDLPPPGGQARLLPPSGAQDLVADRNPPRVHASGKFIDSSLRPVSNDR